MAFWTEALIEDYDRACKLLKYPQSVVGDSISRFIKQDDKVMDVGAGSGATASFLSPLCQKVYALEPDDAAFNYIRERIRKEGLHNVTPIHARWPADGLPSFSIVSGFYLLFFANAIFTVRPMVEQAERGGIFLVERSLELQPMYREIQARIGAASRNEQPGCVCGCRIVGMLEGLGAKASCQAVDHDFGQPVNDEDAAAEFIRRMLHVDERYKEPISKIAKEYMTEREGHPFVSYERKSCLIFFEKQEMY